MAAPMEVAVCTDSAAQLWSCIVWELHSGANLLTYRGGQAGPRGLALLNGEYLLAAQLGKNYISAWELQRKDQLQQKIMCPGPVTCLTTSPNGLYVLAGIAESIYLWELWEVSSGELLLSVLFDVAIVAVTMDLAEHHLFCGGSDGSIFQVDLCTWVSGQALGLGSPVPPSVGLIVPRNQVTCLSVSTDGSVLLSGSHDETVRLWDVQSKQCIRTVTLKGPVTNASIMLAPLSMLSSDFRPGLPLPHFNKHLLGAEHGDEPHRGGFTLRLGLHQQGSEPSHLERAEQLHAVMSGTMEKSVLGGQDQLRIRVAELEDEVRNLRKVNRDLFDFSTRIITRPAKRCTSGRKEVSAHPRSQQHGP
ncbi:WD repeat-containing protein 18 [Puma concolor]|uniref:WD repeat-containing protein 18 n=1 Tax=Puma concolor TaxID=9696 RepID=A0A6P6H8L9_PUMCO|nr:WD repeat-containing protein 18 [Puma concolor]